MFEKSASWQRYSDAPEKVVRVHMGYVPTLDESDDDDRSAFRIAVAVAILFHVALFLTILPKMAARVDWKGSEKPVYVVKQIKFNPPPPAREQVIPKRQEKKRVIPVPDPTPDEPEPLRVEEVEVPDVDVIDLAAAFGIPDAPAATGVGGAPLRVGGDVTAPVKLFGPSPPYTEEARLGRVQGVVILEAIIDAMGNVNDVKVLKGLPSGLSESAVATTATWKFQPALRNGSPVPVFYNLTVRFSLQ